jgi:hypothetical protein
MDRASYQMPATPARIAKWTNETWVTIGPVEQWLAPSLNVANRWADEVNARGGHATIESIESGLETCIYVRVFRMPEMIHQ